MNIPTSILIIVAIYIVGLLFAIKWIYADAKAREMKPWGWVLLTGFLSPNFIGLIAYLVFRRKDSEITCGNCGKSILQPMNYCYWCSAENEKRNKNLPPKPSNVFLIIGVITMLACIITLFTTIFKMYG